MIESEGRGPGAGAAGPSHDSKPIFIYHITHGEDGRVYVGQTAQPQQRWKQHQRKPPQLLRNDAQRYERLTDGFSFSIVKEVTGGAAAAHAAESAEIQRLRDTGVRVYNRITGDPARSRFFWAWQRERRHGGGRK
ncbi:hypothetical protein CHLRE_06g310550v5 [Chlamydomonas reinhardtii]|uniref:GIY-YIG domain-containing protein n=1 Tax=Chlamydomonas reinhardtii TaxID=3055 RepID=A0A2K3DRM2_CHLRE|nr:uncharacterized protein CHLRE_06g310550v5 [Chlamydomonas reinhardtii]PNW83192.1 hypothetical protein CHLRE_06g310550v5 [Chlamydomonas reinhardtii]